jgi:hypothetical protein
MESTAYSNGRFDGTNHAANKWITDMSSIMMNIYNQQSNLVVGFYNNFFNFIPGMNRTPWNTAMNSANQFKNDGLASMFTPFNSFKTDGRLNLLTFQYEDVYKQAMEFNNKCAIEFQKQFQNLQTNFNEVNQKLQEIVEAEWKAVQKGINSLTETYNKQGNFSAETNRKFMEEVHHQLALATKRNEQMWADVLKKTQSSDHKTEKENEHKEKENEHANFKKQNKAHSHSVHAHI